MGTGVFSSNHNKYSSLTTANHIQNRQTTTMQQQYNITQQHVQLQYNQNVNLQHGMQYSSGKYILFTFFINPKGIVPWKAFKH